MPFAILDLSFAKLETTYDTPIAFVGADNIGRVTLNLRPSLALLRRAEHIGSQSIQGHDPDHWGGEWDLNAEVKVSTPAGTYPELSPFLEAAIGQKATGAGVATYSHLLGALRSLQLANFNQTDFGEVVNGAWVRTLEVAHEGGQYVLAKAAGGFASYASLKGSPAVVGVHAEGVTTIQLAAGHADKIISGRTGSRMTVDFGATLDNNGAGYVITAVNYDDDEITISPGLISGEALAGGEVIRIFAPAPVFAGVPLSTTEGKTSVDGTELDYIRFAYAVDTGITGSALEGSRNRPSRLELEEHRVVSGEFSGYVIAANAHLQGRAARDEPIAIAHRWGPNTAASRLKVNIPKAALTLFPYEKTEKGVYIMSASFEAERSAANEDESTVVFD